MSMAFLRGHWATGNLGLPGASRAHRLRSESPRRRREVRRECKHLSLWQKEAQAGARAEEPRTGRGPGLRGAAQTGQDRGWGWGVLRGRGGTEGWGE